MIASSVINKNNEEHTVEPYRFKVLALHSNELPKEQPIKEPIQDTNSDARDDFESNTQNAESSSTPAQESSNLIESTFIEELLKRTDDLSGNIVKLQMQIEHQENEFKIRLENETQRAKEEGLREGHEQAADQIIGEGIAQIILIGNPAEIKALAEKHQLKNIDKATIIDPQSHAKKEEYADLLVELRKSKGMTKEQAMKLVTDPLYLATLMIKSGDADGEVVLP